MLWCILSPVQRWRRAICAGMQWFSDLMAAFCRIIPRAIFGDVRRLVVLAWAVVGVCLTQTVSFNKWGEVVISRATFAHSHQRRFLLWLHHNYVRPITFSFPLLKAAISDWSLEQVVYLALDTTDLHNGFILIRLAIIIGGVPSPSSGACADARAWRSGTGTTKGCCNWLW